MTIIIVPTWLLWLLIGLVAANAFASIYKSWLLLKLEKERAAAAIGEAMP